MVSLNKKGHVNMLQDNTAGYERFVRTNPKSDKITAIGFDHIEFYCADATFAYKRFIYGLGMDLISKSDFSTGNNIHCSYLLQSGDVKMLFSAPFSTPRQNEVASEPSIPSYNTQLAQKFFIDHGFAVRAIAIVVNDVQEAFNTMILNGAVSVLPPTIMMDKSGRGSASIAEIQIYGDVVLRLIDRTNFQGNFLPNFKDVKKGDDDSAGIVQGDKVGRYGIRRFDHIVGNVFSLQKAMKHIVQLTGFHEFAEFLADDVGTVDSGLNSVVLANNNEFILMPLNEPTYGTKRKSQIQTYLEQNNGEGVQHIALFSRDIFETMRCMRAASNFGGFEFMDPQPDSYYEKLKERIGDSLTEDQYRQVRELGLLVDKDDQGVLLQIFTKPL
eukprot:gene32878-43970_t